MGEDAPVAESQEGVERVPLVVEHDLLADVVEADGGAGDDRPQQP